MKFLADTTNSAPLHGIKCQSNVKRGADPESGSCQGQISGASSEPVLFHAAAEFGFEKVNGVWLCLACKPKLRPL